MVLFERVDEGMMNMNKGRKKRKKWRKKFIGDGAMLYIWLKIKKFIEVYGGPSTILVHLIHWRLKT
jgi:hypothetical protein